MADKDKASPASTSLAYDRMAPRWNVIETLLGGTEAMRAAGQTYLPQHQEETDLGYQERLQAAVLTNFVEQTLDALAGKPFTEPVAVGDDVPPQIVDQVLDDVDLQGNKLHVFCSQWFREGMAKALCHVLVDMPKPEPKPDGQPRTLADDRKEGVRPYWVLIKPECLIFARASIIDGVETLQHVRIVETITEQDGFVEVSRQRIRVLEPGTVTLYRKNEQKSKDTKEVWEVEASWNTGLTYIPLVTFYADRQGFMEGKPPLLDLAWLNITHWQSTADQRHILTVSRFPILACSGASADESDPIVVGPNKVLYNGDPQGKFYYVEHTGAAIEAGRNDLKDLEETCSNYGAEFLREKPGDETATGRALDSAEASSDLSNIAGNFEDAVAQALWFTAQWMRLGEDAGGTVQVIKDYNLEAQEAAGMQAIQAARTARDISRHTFLEALKLRGYLPEDFDAEEDAERLLEEQDAALARAGFDLDPLGNPKKLNPDAEGEDGEDEGEGTETQPSGKAPAKKVAKKAAKKVTK